MHRRRAMAMAVVAIGTGLVACGSGGAGSSTAADHVVTTQAPATTEAPTTTAEPVTSSQVVDLPEDLEERVTDGPGQDEARRLLEAAVETLGPERAGIYNAGDAFEVRVVEPTPQDEEVVAAAQSQTSMPLRLVAASTSARWLEESMMRLDRDLTHPGVTVGVSFVTATLTVSVDHELAPDLGVDALTVEVHDLVAGYLTEGQRAGSVADGVTADQAVTIGEGGFG